MSKTRIIIICILSCVVLIAGIMLVKTIIEYRSAEQEYDDLTRYVSEDISDSEPAQEELANDSDNTVSDTAKQEKKNKKKEKIHEIKRNYTRSDYPSVQVDFDGLREINPDFTCWLYVGGANINYPVTKYSDNEYYLHKTFEGKDNSSGCIFMDWEVDPRLTSWNTFIYGHNMKNGTMFGKLKQFIWNNGTYEKDPYIYIFRPEGIYRYEIFSYYLDSPDSKMYYTCDNLKEYRAYLRTAVAKSQREIDITPTVDDTIVTLVTCSGSGEGKQRFFVHGVLIDRYLYMGGQTAAD